MLDCAALGDDALDQFEFESMSTFFGKDNHKGLKYDVDDKKTKAVGKSPAGFGAGSSSKSSSKAGVDEGKLRDKEKNASSTGSGSKGFGAAKK
jgi:hypothetical protein